MSYRRQRSIPLSGRYRQVSLYWRDTMALNNMSEWMKRVHWELQYEPSQKHKSKFLSETSLMKALPYAPTTIFDQNLRFYHSTCIVIGNVKKIKSCEDVSLPVATNVVITTQCDATSGRKFATTQHSIFSVLTQFLNIFEYVLSQPSMTESS